ncbi:helix-turn-helix transcriptional regulator [Planosporangium thailandense]|uniref:Helix-turn-helix transcriptional regulator n=1 Tax=Planosporangium thailandense TaxID=765197 RepID=A0ABX0XTF9_9ACTN|nr:helix-turn-helix transcriptional regulator [Planosporangium thailandense]
MVTAPRDIGGFIRDLRRNAQISLRQLAEQAGVSNPYLSQIERGLRKPSAEVLAQLAHALRVSTPVMYLRAGLLDASGGQEGVLAAIAADPDLTIAQKQSLTQIYETFRRENLRSAEVNDVDSSTFDPPVEPGTHEETAATTRKTATRRATAARKTAATGQAEPAAGTDETTAPARKPRKAVKRQPRTTRSQSSSEAPSAEGSGAQNAKERTEEKA